MPVIEAALVTAVMETSVPSTFSCWAAAKASCTVQQDLAVSNILLEVAGEYACWSQKVCSRRSTTEPAVLNIEACNASGDWLPEGRLWDRSCSQCSHRTGRTRCCHAALPARLTTDVRARLEGRLGRGCALMGPRSMPAKMSMLCCCAI